MLLKVIGTILTALVVFTYIGMTLDSIRRPELRRTVEYMWLFALCLAFAIRLFWR